MGEIGSDAKDAVPPLVERLEDDDQNVRKQAAEALDQIESIEEEQNRNL